MGWQETLGKIFSSTWGIAAIGVIVMLAVFAITDIDEKLFAPENTLNFLVFGLLIAVVFLIMRPSPIFRPDPMEIFAKATKTSAFAIKEYHFEKIEKSTVFWQSGNNVYYYCFDVPRKNVRVWALIQYAPNVVVLDLLEKDLTQAEKKKKLGQEWSVEEVKNLLDTQKKAEELVEGV